MKKLYQVFFIALISAGMWFAAGCKKNITVAPIVFSTPLQALINSDTSLAVFYAIVKKSSDSLLYTGVDSVTVLIPTDSAFAVQGITLSSVKSMTAASADSLLRYHFVADTVGLLPGAYTAYKSKLGPALYGYGNPDSSGNYFNGSLASYQRLPGSNAAVYELSAPLHFPAAAIAQLIASDTSLTYFAEAVKHANINLVPGSGWNTILAPVNNAFIAAGYPDPASIDNADADTLSKILLYHVLPGQYFSNSFTGLTTITTLQGTNVNLSFINNAVQFTGTNNTAATTIATPNRIAGTSIILQNINGLLQP